MVELDALRHTPAGVPVLGFRIGHRSKQVEAGLPRDIEVEIQAKAVGQVASLLAGAKLGSYVRVTGFLAHKSAKSRQPVVHVNTIEFVEGMNNGF